MGVGTDIVERWNFDQVVHVWFLQQPEDNVLQVRFV